MADMGLGAAYGADAMSQRIRQRILDQLAEQAQTTRLSLAGREMALREQEAQQRAQEFQQNLAEKAQNANIVSATKLAPLLPLDQNVTPDTASVLRSGGLGSQLYTPPTQGETASGQPFNPETANPAMNLGTAPQQVATEKRQYIGRLVSRLPESSPLRMSLEYQQATGDNPPAGLFEKTPPAGQIVQTDKGFVRVGPDNAITPLGIQPPQKEPVDKLERVEHRDPQTGKTIIEYLPQSQLRGQTFERGMQGATESRAASAQAVVQTSDDMVASLKDPQVQAQLGPVLGRYNTLRDFIGNPPPEFSKLAGQIESFSLANMGVHGMRSAQGAQMISKLLDQRHTPTSLIATIQGLTDFSRHFLANEGVSTDQSGSPASPKPLAVKRYNPATKRVE